MKVNSFFPDIYLYTEHTTPPSLHYLQNKSCKRINKAQKHIPTQTVWRAGDCWSTSLDL